MTEKFTPFGSIFDFLAYLCIPIREMAIRSLSYLDIPSSRRQEAAARSLGMLRERLGDPSLSPEQAQALKERMATLEKWTSGTLEEQ